MHRRTTSQIARCRALHHHVSCSMTGRLSGASSFSMEWEIDSFRSSEPKRLHSPVMSLPGIPGFWNLWLDRVISVCDVCICVYVRHSPIQQSALKVTGTPRLQIKCLGSNRKPPDTFACTLVQEGTPASGIWKGKVVLHAYELVNTAQLNFTLTLKLEGEVHISSLPLTVSDIPTLSNDLKKVYELGGEGDPDVTLVGDDEVEVTAHKFILSARSPVFAAMFQHDMVEKEAGKAKLTGIKSDVIREMVHYMYTDEEPRNIDTLAISILQAAEMYNLKGLKQMCETHLGRNLEVSNVHTILCHAITFSYPNLKQKCIEYVTEHIEEFRASDTWEEAKSLLPADVMFEIMELSYPK